MAKSKTTTLRTQQKQARYQAMIDAAKSLFAQCGYEATTIEMIAERAFVSTPTVYNYFGTKNALLVEVITQGDQPIIVALKDSVKTPKGSAEEEISKLLILMVRMSLETMDHQTWRHAFAITVLDADNEISDGYAQLNNTLYDAIEDLLPILIQQGKLPKHTDVPHLRGLFERLNHALFGELISNDEMTFEQYQDLIRSYVNTIISGIK